MEAPAEEAEVDEVICEEPLVEEAAETEEDEFPDVPMHPARANTSATASTRMANFALCFMYILMMS